MQTGFMLLALLGGVGLAVQMGFNSTMRGVLGSAPGAAVVNFMVGLGALLILAVLTRVPLPTRSTFEVAPWWAWCGGLLGAFYVSMAALTGQRIGATALLALTVTGQLIASVIMDHYGLLGMTQHAISLGRICGVLLLVSGTLLIVL